MFQAMRFFEKTSGTSCTGGCLQCGGMGLWNSLPRSLAVESHGSKMPSASAVIWGTQNEGFQAILLWQNGWFLVRESPQEIPSIQF